MSNNDSDSSLGSVDDMKPEKTDNKSEKMKRPADETGDKVNMPKKAKWQKNSDGDEMIPLGKNKFVTVREFRGKVLVDIREYYEKDEKMLPGKKGISLTREQFSDLTKYLPEINDKINEI